MPNVVVAALYRFVRLDDYEDLREPLLENMIQNQVKGTLLLASEGINGTIAGTQEGVNKVISWLGRDSRLGNLQIKISNVDKNPFYRTKVKLKKEIVTMGVEDIDPNDIVGRYVKPEDWNALISDPDVTLIDTRNKYEVKIGTFENAVNPETETFRDFPSYVATKLDPQKNKKVAMFCTGGIRCEKSTAYLKQQGFDEVYHLQGGILNYLKQVPEEQSLWRGECFVFDNRVTVDHQLQKGEYEQCHACRMPITAQDQQSSHYIKGVSCPHCFEKHTDVQRKGYAERERQVEFARQRGEDHIGQSMDQTIEQRRKVKLDFKEEQRKNNDQ